MEISDSIVKSIHQESVDIRCLRENVISDITGIDHISEPISYEEFFNQYLLPNKVCILGTWATEGWQSRQDWVTDESKPNLQFLHEHFGIAKCPVADCNHSQYDAHIKSEMTLAEFVDYMKSYKESRYPQEQNCLYLKDWHFQRDFPDYSAYEVPVFFQSDWLNEFWGNRADVSNDDYKFVYIGPKGSWTPFHSDVFRSYSWSANICGRKKWILFPPGQEEYLKDKLGHLVFDLNSPELQDTTKFPNVSKITKRFEIFQESGEVIFVPSGWHHQVFNVEDTISINHNWMNGCNIDLCWRHLENSLLEVKAEIFDCKDMEDWGTQCQLILKANAGIDYADFYRYLHNIAESRITQLQHYLIQSEEHHEQLVERDADPNCKCEILSKYQINHAVFDLAQISKLVFCMKRNKDFLQLDFDQFEVRPKALITTMDDLIEEYLLKT